MTTSEKRCRHNKLFGIQNSVILKDAPNIEVNESKLAMLSLPSPLFPKNIAHVKGD